MGFKENASIKKSTVWIRKWGTAFERYKNTIADDGITVSKSGFWIDPSYPELGWSPDGLLYTIMNKLVGVLEINCPVDKD